MLHDGTPLWFPTPIVRPDGQLDRTNNYTLDGVRQRVIGFNLIKTSSPVTRTTPIAIRARTGAKPSQRVEIGEECAYRVRTGGWFGFETPGFTLIEVDNVAVTDNLPAGQGYVSSTDPDPTSSPQIAGHLADGQPGAADAERPDCAGRAVYLELQPDARRSIGSTNGSRPTSRRAC